MGAARDTAWPGADRQSCAAKDLPFCAKSLQVSIMRKSFSFLRLAMALRPLAEIERIAGTH
ncbi:MAG: hypothetical protein AAFQ81_11130, partial [Pseudomonadota bacterium]